MPPLRSATACAAAAGKVRAMTTPDFDRSSLEARARAEAEGQEPRLEHYLLALLHPESTAAVDVLRRLGVEPAAVGATVRARMAVQDGGTGMPVAYRVAAWFGQAALEATALDHDRLTTAHLLLAACAERGTVGADALAAHGVDPQRVRDALRRRGAEEVLPDRSRVRALLISNSTMHGGGYLEHCAAEIRAFLGARRRVLFVPYALADHDGYAARARKAFAAFGHDLVSVHEVDEPVDAVLSGDAVFVGGGNTFRLLKALYDRGLFGPLRRRAVQDGMPYIGSSAGTNVATLSIRTTNDMPIVQPPSLTALGLVPFQINPHYLDPDPNSTHMGETREERLRQFHEEQVVPVLAMREGCMLRVEGGRAELRGSTRARLFRRGEEATEHTPPCDLSFLLQGVW